MKMMTIRQHKTSHKECNIKNDMTQDVKNMNIRQCKTNHSRECMVKYNKTQEIRLMIIRQHKIKHRRECKVKHNIYKEVDENTNKSPTVGDKRVHNTVKMQRDMTT
jgi:hypothetical protein